MTKNFLIADLKHFCDESLSHFIAEQCVTPRGLAYYEYLEGRIESLQMVINKLVNYD